MNIHKKCFYNIKLNEDEMETFKYLIGNSIYYLKMNASSLPSGQLEMAEAIKKRISELQK